MSADEHPAYARDWWQYMRREILNEPRAEDYGMTQEQGERIAKQCHIEFERHVMLKVRERRQLQLL